MVKDLDSVWAEAIAATGMRFEDGSPRVVAKMPEPVTHSNKSARTQATNKIQQDTIIRLFPSGYVGRLMGFMVTRNRTGMTLDEVRELFGNSPDFIHMRNLTALTDHGWILFDGEVVTLTERAIAKYFPAGEG